MRKIILMLAVFGVINGCRQPQRVINPFDNFKNLIPHIKLPYKIACYDTVKRLKLSMSDSMFKKYAPAGANGIVGMVADSELYSAILYIVSGDRQYPVLQTYDTHGAKLNDIGLINGTCCGTQPNCFGFSWGEITPDLFIVSADSERIFVMGKDGNPLKTGSRRIDSTEVYSITHEGFIRLNTDASVTAHHKISRVEIMGAKNMVAKEPPKSTSPVAGDSQNYEDSTKIVYKVQILSSTSPVSADDPRFNGIKQVEVYMDKNKYHYTTGHFTSRDEALVMQIKLRAMGFKEAFVVAFKGKERI